MSVTNMHGLSSSLDLHILSVSILNSAIGAVEIDQPKKESLE